MTAMLERNAVTTEDKDQGPWEDQADCRNYDSALFFPGGEGNEPAYPLPAAKAICDRCPVRAECLQWSISLNIEFGTFAGMTGYQRQLLNRKKPRKACPGCGSDEIDTLERAEICVACGISWERGLLDDEDR